MIAILPALTVFCTFVRIEKRTHRKTKTEPPYTHHVTTCECEMLHAIWGAVNSLSSILNHQSHFPRGQGGVVLSR